MYIYTYVRLPIHTYTLIYPDRVCTHVLLTIDARVSSPLSFLCLVRSARMLLKPKRTAHRKQQKVYQKGYATPRRLRGTIALRACAAGRVTARQRECVRRTIRQNLNRDAKVWLRSFPDRPVTKKPREVRMGNGKGGVEYWTAMVRPGQLLYEVERGHAHRVVHALKAASAKLALPTNIYRERRLV